MLKHYDPYKDITYGRLKGDKKDAYLKIEFSEGKLYQTSEGYVLMANLTKISGAIRAFKPELPVEPDICAIPIYNKNHDEWSKDSLGKATSTSIAPSIFETNLCNHFDLTYSTDQAYAGTISFLQDDQTEGLSDKELIATINKNCHLAEVDETGKLPKYEANANSNGRKSYGMSPGDKLIWLKKEMCESIKDSGCSEEMSLLDLSKQLVEESEDETSLAIYIDLLKGLT